MATVTDTAIEKQLGIDVDTAAANDLLTVAVSLERAYRASNKAYRNNLLFLATTLSQ